MIAHKSRININTSKFIELILSVFLISIFVISLLYTLVFKDALTFEIASIISIVSTMLSFSTIYFSKRIMTVGTTSVLFLYFTLTHFGATTIYFLFPEVIESGFLPHQYLWLNSQYISFAILYSVIGQLSFLFSSLIFGKKKMNRVYKKKISSIWLPKLGLMCIYITFIYFVYNIINGNISLKLGYYEFISWRTQSAFFAYAIFLLATGFILTISTGTKKQVKHALIIYSLVSGILLLTGNKGEVLYAILAGIGIYYSNGNKISKKIFLIGFTLFFVVIPFITSVRHGSIINSLSQISFNVSSPFVEMGWQMRTVEKAVSWISQGEKLGFGISYFAPVQRILSSLSLGIIPRILISNVPWAFGERLPGWGFSQIAESYYNFSLLGPILFYSIQGWFSQLAENEKNNDYKRGLYSSIVVILMILTRNRFSFVPGQIIMSLFIVFIGSVLDRRYRI